MVCEYTVIAEKGLLFALLRQRLEAQKGNFEASRLAAWRSLARVSVAMAALRLIALLSGVSVAAAAPAIGPRALVPGDGLAGVRLWLEDGT